MRTSPMISDGRCRQRRRLPALVGDGNDSGTPGALAPNVDGDGDEAPLVLTVIGDGAAPNVDSSTSEPRGRNPTAPIPAPPRR
jgi:hypothetical protein